MYFSTKNTKLKRSTAAKTQRIAAVMHFNVIEEHFLSIYCNSGFRIKKQKFDVFEKSYPDPANLISLSSMTNFKKSQKFPAIATLCK